MTRGGAARRQGWFFLSDDAGDPLRDHRGEAARVRLAFAVAEREAEALQKSLAAARAADGDGGGTWRFPFALVGGVPERRFVSVPPAAEWATVKPKHARTHTTHTIQPTLLQAAVDKLYARALSPHGCRQH